MGTIKASGKPRLFTFFKHSEINTGNANRDDLRSLWAFQDKLKGLGHYPTAYRSSEDLRLQLRDQLSRLLDLGGDLKERRRGL